MRNSLIVLLGPTGVGKTDLSIDIAKHFNTEIISCDSRQLFTGMKIGTAVPTNDQLASVKHHLIRIIPPTSYYSASLFERDVLTILPGMFEKMNPVLMVGGSGLYIDAVCNGIDDIPDVDPIIRKRYLQKFKDEGIESIRADLKILDPEHYFKVDLRNHKRILRALEICETTGKPYSSFMKKAAGGREFNIIKVGIDCDRQKLYNIINQRVDRMIDDGLVEEVRGLIKLRDKNALNTVGYSELFDYIDGKISLVRAIDLIKRNTRRYAKRQLTWWAKDKDIKWFYPSEYNMITTWIENRLSKEAL